MGWAKRSSRVQAAWVLGGFAWLALVSGCERAPAEEAAEATPPQAVRSASVEQRTPEHKQRYAGVLRAQQRAQPAFLQAGTLSERPVDIGDRVSQGEPLAVLYNPALTPTVNAARARVGELDERIAQLERDLERARSLRERNLNSADAVDQLASELAATRQTREQAQAQLSQARDQLDESVLKAPFSGRVVAVLAEPGDFVAAGQPVLQLSGDNGLEVQIWLPAAKAQELPAGTPVTITRPIGGGRFTGEVSQVGGGDTGPAAVVVSVSAAALTAGQPVHVHVSASAGNTEPSLWVPLAAVVDPGGDAPHVFRLQQQADATRVERVTVVAGRLDGSEVAITKGLNPGDQIVVGGQGRLSDGQSVRVLP